MGISWWEQNWYEPGKHVIVNIPASCGLPEAAQRIAPFVKQKPDGTPMRGQWMEDYSGGMIVKLDPSRVADAIEALPLRRLNYDALGVTFLWDEEATAVPVPVPIPTDDIPAL